MRILDIIMMLLNGISAAIVFVYLIAPMTNSLVVFALTFLLLGTAITVNSFIWKEGKRK